jgi:hypothetical protein
VAVEAGSRLSRVEKKAFRCCSRLVAIPGVTHDSDIRLSYLGKAAFERCFMIRSVVIGRTVESIGMLCFGECARLETVVFEHPSQVSVIGDSAFAMCKMLESITIPSSVKRIGNHAFASCRSLVTATFEPNWQPESMGELLFEDCPFLRKICIPRNVPPKALDPLRHWEALFVASEASIADPILDSLCPRRIKHGGGSCDRDEFDIGYDQACRDAFSSSVAAIPGLLRA